MNALTMKLIGGIAVALALAVAVHLARYWHAQATAARDQVTAICSAARAAAHNPKLDCRDTAEQVRTLGDSLEQTTGALERQSAAVNALAVKTAELQQSASAATQAGRERAADAQRVAGGLIASSRSSERVAKPCEPSEALKEAWK